MPAIPLHPPNKDRYAGLGEASHSLPQLLQTPSGLAILEIQGTVNAPSALSNGSSPIGKLVFPQYDANKPTDDTSWQKRVYLYVGKHQRLTGEVKKLAKPIAVVRRRQSDTQAGDISPGDDGELEIAEIVHYKILFAHRPEPVGGD
jgi:chromosome transmission fidelity protein 8